MDTTAKYLLLCDEAPRAILLDGELSPLAEVIEEDGFIVESLLRGAMAVPLPRPETLATVVPPPSPTQPMRCFQLP